MQQNHENPRNRKTPKRGPSGCLTRPSIRYGSAWREDKFKRLLLRFEFNNNAITV
jgi:hypothetical protein